MIETSINAGPHYRKARESQDIPVVTSTRTKEHKVWIRVCHSADGGQFAISLNEPEAIELVGVLIVRLGWM